MIKKILTLMILCTFLLIGNVSAFGYEDVSLGTFTKDHCINIQQTCDNCTYINITSITFPNSTKAVSNVEMIQDSTDFSYEFCSASGLGEYFVNYKGDENGITSIAKTWFDVTQNGRENPSGIVIVVYSILFLGLLAFLIYFLFYTLFFFIEFKMEKEQDMKPFFTIKDLVFNLSGFFVLLGFQYLSRIYIGNVLINKIVGLTVFVSAWTNVGLSIVAILLSFTIASWGEILRGLKRDEQW